MHRTPALIVTLAAIALGSSAPSSAAPGQPHLNNIVQRADSTRSFTTFAALLKRAGLASTLSGRGPYTVFAPTDAAFARLPPATLNGLLRHPEQLKAVLLYHVVKGNLPVSKLATSRGTRTLDDGKPVKFTTTASGLRINAATVVRADLTTSNGVLQAIDRVLEPAQLAHARRLNRCASLPAAAAWAAARPRHFRSPCTMHCAARVGRDTRQAAADQAAAAEGAVTDRSLLRQDLDVPVRSVHADPLPVPDQPGGMLHPDDGRQAVFPCDHRAMGHQAPRPPSPGP